MSNYRPPLDDMQFVLTQMHSLESIAALPGYEEATADMLSAILSEAGKLAAEVLAPLNQSGDAQGAKLTAEGHVEVAEGFAEAYRQFVESGWGSLTFPEAVGGQGLPLCFSAPVQEMWQAANLSWGLCPLLTQGAIEALQANASEQLKTQYLPQLISGQWSGTMNLTEPQAGSDLAALRCKAEPEGDHYRIKGQKIFITWGEHDMAENIVHLVLARLPDAPAGVKGISMFLVPKYLVNDDGSVGERNEVHAVSLEHKMGIHASPTCVMSYGDSASPQSLGAVGYLVGQPHQGLACMFTMMNSARLAVGIQGVSIADRAYQQAVAYARERVQGIAAGAKTAGPIIQHPDVRRMLMTMRALTESGRALAYAAYVAEDFQHKGDNADKETQAARVALLTPIVKGWCTEMAQEVAGLGVQVHGGMGFIEETGAAQHARDARILTIYEGTTGIQAQDFILRKTLADGGAAMNDLLEAMLKTSEVAEQGSDRLHDLVRSWLPSVEALYEAKAAIVQNAEADIHLAGSAAFNYLMLAGYVCAGWQMLESALAAERWQQQAPEQARFCEDKLITAEFYMEHLLPRYLTCMAGLMAGSDAIMALPEDRF